MSHLLARGVPPLLLLAVLAGLSGSCFSSSDDDALGPGASTGASNGAGGSGTTYEPPTCDQGCQDYLVGWALDDTLWFLWNQHIAGKPAGVQDIMGDCALGGTVHITGMNGVAGGTNTTDIEFTLADCENSDVRYDLTFTGTVSMVGTFNVDVDSTAEVFSAPGLAVSGSLDYLDDPTIDQACDVTVKQDDSAISGRMCGRDFDQEALNLGSGGSSSTQGGSGNARAGTSSGNCACFCPDNTECTGAQTPNPCGLDADGIPEPCACPVGCR
jgi:hypothetical protein